ncbi:MAG: HAMP domain-containing histidine kinase [Alphaproteobacteria bacterium]|nr:HAMP domain-containing histidine kinase [Alphaproteobacteria bacterium]
MQLSFFSAWLVSCLCPWKEKEIPEYLLLPTVPLLEIAIALVIFILLLAIYIWMMSQKITNLNNALTANQLALAKEQKISTMGALSAAAAHELGSPLNTISLVIKEMLSALPSESALQEDVQLVATQTDRCRDILLELSRNIRQEEDLPRQSLPLSSLIEQAAQTHKLPHITLAIQKETPDPEPTFMVTADLMHGLGNILQNAFQFATSTVRITLKWTLEEVEAVIQDDGRGYPPDLLPRLGEPQPSGRKSPTDEKGRKGGHMGLGLFIAKTLLSQRQGEVHFSNDGGARCLIKWPRSIEIVDSEVKNKASISNRR